MTRFVREQYKNILRKVNVFKCLFKFQTEHFFCSVIFKPSSKFSTTYGYAFIYHKNAEIKYCNPG